MDFRVRKFAIRETDELIKVSLRDVRPFALLRGPAYVLMRRNERYLAVRGPLDFFTPEDLIKLSSHSVLYFTSFVESTEPYAQAGRSLKKILLWMAETSPHPVDPFERSDAILRVVGPLWSADLRLEPFFATHLIEAFCGPLPPQALVAVRDQSTDLYDERLLASSGVTVLMLLLGEMDLDHLRRVREEVFTTGSSSHVWARHALTLIQSSALKSPYHPWSWSEWDRRNPLVARLQNRMNRISEKLAVPYTEIPSVFGEKGLLHG